MIHNLKFEINGRDSNNVAYVVTLRMNNDQTIIDYYQNGSLLVTVSGDRSDVVNSYISKLNIDSNTRNQLFTMIETTCAFI